MRWLLLLMALFGSSASECTNSLQWSTGNGQMLLNGKTFVLKGVNYFGFETETFAPHGIWSYSLDWFLDFIKNNNFNAIRVPFSLELVRTNPPKPNINTAANPGLAGKSALEVLDIFIDRAADRGLLIMLDNHRITSGGGISPLWYNDEYPESVVIDLWKKLFGRVKNKWNVFALDLKNEPHDAATWGNSNQGTDWNKAAERMINALSDFPGLFFVEGIEWGNRLENVAQFPINTGNAALNKRVVYSPHCYGPSVYDRPEFNTPDFPNNLDSIYMGKYGFIVKSTGQPVVVGEWGGRAEGRDKTWNEWYVSFLRKRCLTNNFYWCLNPNSGDTGGLLQDDWQTPIPFKIDFTNKVQPNPTKFQMQGGQICITHGRFPESQCQVGGNDGGNDEIPTLPSPRPQTTSRPTPPPPSGGGSSLVSLALVNNWMENGQRMNQYTVEIKNGGSSTACNAEISIDGNIASKWNLESVSNGVFRMPAWWRVQGGATDKQAGFIARGEARVQLKNLVAQC